MRTLLRITIFILLPALASAQEGGVNLKIARLGAVSVNYLYGEHFRNALGIYDVREMLPESNTFRKALKVNPVVYAPAYGNLNGHSEFALHLTFDPYNPGREAFCRYFQVQLGMSWLSPIRYQPAEPYSITTQRDAGTHYVKYTNIFLQPDSTLCYMDTIETHDYTYELKGSFVAAEVSALFHNSYESRLQLGAGFGMSIIRGVGTSLDLSHTRTLQVRHEYSYTDSVGDARHVIDYIPAGEETEAQTVKPKMKGMRFYFPFEAGVRLTSGEGPRVILFARGVIGTERFSAVVYNSRNKYSKIGVGVRIAF